MTFTDLFIKKPVLSIVINLLILIFGMRALFSLSIREFPKLEDTIITITTAYAGANASLMESFITSPIESAIANASGIDYLSSISDDSSSTITAHILLNYDPNVAFTDIMSKVAQTSNILPQESNSPIIDKETDRGPSLMYIILSSKSMSGEQMVDYATRVIQPQLETISGVAKADIFGGHNFAIRIWLDPKKMAALHVSPEEVKTALTANNVKTAAGKTKGYDIAISIKANTSLKSVEAFKRLIITHKKSSLVYLKDIAKIELGAEEYDSSLSFNGQSATGIGITASPSANPLSVITEVRHTLPFITKQFPPNLHANIAYDATLYIRSSIDEVIRTILEAVFVVIVVMFLFLASPRAVMIPMVTIPLSLIGVCSLMLYLGYSINLLTLLAMVLAIGLVVDDAIVIVENVVRYIEKGHSLQESALLGARELAQPIIAMTITLAAAYAPIGFVQGVTGALFKEFAFTLASTVIISGIVALTLSPMMCSTLLSTEKTSSRFSRWIDMKFARLQKKV